MGHRTAKRPGGSELDREDGAALGRRGHLPRPIEDRAVDRVGGRFGGSWNSRPNAKWPSRMRPANGAIG